MLGDHNIRTTLTLSTPAGAPVSDYGAYVLSKELGFVLGQRVTAGRYDCTITAAHCDRLAAGPLVTPNGSVRL